MTLTRPPITFLDQAIEVITRDQRNMKILQSDRTIKAPLLLVPDCSDIVQFVHIDNVGTVQQDAYTEAIRRYFVQSDSLLLIPSWTYEFLSYIHRVIKDNIESYGTPGGFESFLKNYPKAHDFVKAWKSKDFRKAEILYNEDSTWIEILAFTENEYVTRCLGNSIRRFNYLCDQGKFIRISDVLDSNTWKHIDQSTYTLALNNLKRLRAKETGRNEIDARSFTTVSSIDNLVPEKIVTAITSSKEPLKAFYQTIDEAREKGDIQNMPALSLARSPVTLFIGELVRLHAPSREQEYLEKGIDITKELLVLLPKHNKCIKKLSTKEYLLNDPSSINTILDDMPVNDLKGCSEFFGLMTLYNKYYRDVIFRPIEVQPRLTKKIIAKSCLPIESVARVLSKDLFEDSMKSARKSLKDDSIMLLESARPYISIKKPGPMGTLNITQLFEGIEKDFNRDVF